MDAGFNEDTDTTLSTPVKSVQPALPRMRWSEIRSKTPPLRPGAAHAATAMTPKLFGKGVIGTDTVGGTGASAS